MSAVTRPNLNLTIRSNTHLIISLTQPRRTETHTHTRHNRELAQDKKQTMKNTLIQNRCRKQKHSKKEQHPPVNNRAGRLLADWRGGDTTATALPSPPSTDSGIHVDTTISWLAPHLASPRITAVV